MQSRADGDFSAAVLPKAPSGIKGLDEITNGGLPKGRPTLVSGRAGTGKTLLGIQFLVNGATEFGEPGVMMAFEETEAEIIANVASLGFDLPQLFKDQKLQIDYVHLERSQIEETGEYDLEGLFIRLNHAIDAIGAKRVLLDTIEVLFSGLTDQSVIRAELRRLFRWLKDKGVTAIVTGEQGTATLTRHGLEEYVSDCVIALDHRQLNSVYTRRLRVVKYRGSKHETNEFPFLIDKNGISILPVTSLSLDYPVSDERISTGIAALDDMLGGKGFYRGSSILISGSAGTGKTSLCGHIADAACRRGEQVLFLSFEESGSQVSRNLSSIGLGLEAWARSGLLRFHAERVTMFGLETHLTIIHRLVADVKPAVVIVDPVNAYLANENALEVKTMLVRLIDFLKARSTTGVFTALTEGSSDETVTDVDISSLMDSWLLLRDIEANGERNRGLYVLKSRGIANSNQIREFLITSTGVRLKEVYLGTQGILTGTARHVQEQTDTEEAQKLQVRIERARAELQRRKKASEAQAELARAQTATAEMDMENRIEELERQLAQISRRRQDVWESRTGGED